MRNAFASLLLVLSTLLFMAGCTGRELGNPEPTSGIITPTPKPNPPPPVPQPAPLVSEEDKNENLDWVPRVKVECKDKNCIPSAPIVLARTKAKSYSFETKTCVGILIDQNRVLTSASCLPEEVRTKKVKCSTRIVFKFPSYESYLPEQTVYCESVEKFSVAAPIDPKKKDGSEYYWGNKEPNYLMEDSKVFPSYAILKLSQPVYRNIPTIDSFGFSPGSQFQVAKFEGDLMYLGASGTKNLEIKMTTVLCPTIENSTTKKSRFANLTALDCDLKRNVGAPIFENTSYGELRLKGIIHDQTIEGFHSFNRKDGFYGEDVRGYKFNLGIASVCFSNKDCIAENVKHFLKGETVELSEENKRNSNYSMIDWMNYSPLSTVIKWNKVDDLVHHKSENFRAAIPTRINEGSSWNQKYYDVDYKSYGLTMPIPQCVKTFDPAVWVLVFRQLRSLDHTTGYDHWLIGRSFYGNDTIPTSAVNVEIPSLIRKEYGNIGTSNLISNRKFSMEIRYDEKQEVNKLSITLHSFVFPMNNDVYIITELTACEPEPK